MKQKHLLCINIWFSFNWKDCSYRQNLLYNCVCVCVCENTEPFFIIATNFDETTMA